MSFTEDGTSRVVELDGCTLHFHDMGDGRPLIMIHGGGPGAGGWTNYHRNVDQLATDRRVVVPDLVGFGGSSRIPITDTLYRFHADIILKFMDAMGFESADFVGNSLGGGIVLRLLMSHRTRVGSAILMGPGGSLPLFTGWPTLGLKLGMGYYQGEGPTREKLRRLLEMMVWDRALISDELVEQRYQASIDPETLRNPPLGKTNKLNDEVLWREDLSEITNRILIVWGRDDDILPFDAGLMLLRLLPEAQMHIIPRCGHWVMWERPEEFNRVVGSFLRQQ